MLVRHKAGLGQSCFRPKEEKTFGWEAPIHMSNRSGVKLFWAPREHNLG